MALLRGSFHPASFEVFFYRDQSFVGRIRALRRLLSARHHVHPWLDRATGVLNACMLRGKDGLLQSTPMSSSEFVEEVDGGSFRPRRLLNINSAIEAI